MNLRVDHCLDGGPLESWRRLSQINCRLSFLTLRLTALRNLVSRSISKTGGVVNILYEGLSGKGEVVFLVHDGVCRGQLCGGLQNSAKE